MQATPKALLIAAVFATFIACGKPETEDQRHHEANTPAGKVGQAAYGAARESGKVAKAAGKELSKAAHDAHEGWKEAERRQTAKQ